MWSFGTEVVTVCTVCLFERCDFVFQRGLHDGAVFKSSNLCSEANFWFSDKSASSFLKTYTQNLQNLVSSSLDLTENLVGSSLRAGED